MFNSKNIFFIILCFVLISCQTPVKQGNVSEQEEKKENDKIEYVTIRPSIRAYDEFTAVFSKQDIELDFRKSYFVSEAQLFTGIYEGLFSYHPLTLEPVMALAERWRLSDDKKQWTFIIRRNARFSNGDPIRAQDFRNAWISMIDPELASPYSSFFDVIEGARDYRNGNEKDPDKVGIVAEDLRTLVVKLNSPAAFFPAMLCHHSFSPIHYSMIEKQQWSPVNDEEWTPPVTNGPFHIASMNDENIVMQKSNYYWDNESVSFKKITIKLATADEATNLWNSGEARWILGDLNLNTLSDRSGILLNVMFATHYYFIRSSEKPWNDHRVRRAMALVLPWEEIRKNYRMPAETLIFPVKGYPEVEGINETNYEEARELMAEAGLKNKEEIQKRNIPELVMRITPSREAARISILMATAWKEILGFNVRVEVIPFNRYFDSMREDGFVIGSCTWIADFADPYAFLQMWQRDSNLNDARLDDPEYEALIERSMIEEGDKRLATLAEAEKLLLDRGVILPIYYNPAFNVIDTREVDGWYPNALDIHPFKYMSYKTFRPLPGIANADSLQRF
ncbi:MAG: peptide ABC transporter substrate-binding protein [Treponema sp.]|nr:peptide ABC transporter substrate-binding protein [Treponema sp.]MCL2251761.1 peptide ABC transporter substrate-binding protein [Treponema sp.]